MKQEQTTFIVVCAVLGVFTALAVFFLPSIWALPFELPFRIAIGATLFVFCCIVAKNVLDETGKRDTQPNIPTAIFLGIILVTAFMFPMDTFFYGDGGLLIPQIFKLASGEGYQYDLLLNAKSSPLTGFLLINLSHFVPDFLDTLGIALPATGHYPFRWLSIFCLLALSLYLLIAVKKHKTLYTLFVLGTAGTLLYFGYVEYYVLSFTAIAIFLISSENAIENNGSLWLPVLAFIVALAGHFSSIALLPALAFVVLHKKDSSKTTGFTLKRMAGYIGVVIAIGMATYFVLGYQSSDSRIVMPLLPVTNDSGTQSYTLFSIAHLRDLANIFLLLAPIQTVALIVLFATKKHSQVFSFPIVKFYFLAAVFFFLFLFFANTSLGLARDWDIAAPLGIILSLFAFGAVRAGDNTYWQKTSFTVGMLSALYTCWWLVVNISPSMSASRFEHVLSIDSDKMYRDYAHSGYEALRKHYRNIGNAEKDIALSKTKIELLDYPTDYLYLIDVSLRRVAENPTEYLELQKWMLNRLALQAEELRVNSVDANYSISIAQIDSLAEVIAQNAYVKQTYEQVQPDIVRVAKHTGAPQPYPVIAAFETYKQKQYDEAIEKLQQLINREFHNPQIYTLLGTSLALRNRYSEALTIVEEGVQKYPNNGRLLFTLADWYIKAGIKLDRAKELLLHAQVVTENKELNNRINQLLSTLP